MGQNTKDVRLGLLVNQLEAEAAKTIKKIQQAIIQGAARAYSPGAEAVIIHDNAFTSPPIPIEKKYITLHEKYILDIIEKIYAGELSYTLAVAMIEKAYFKNRPAPANAAASVKGQLVAALDTFEAFAKIKFDEHNGAPDVTSLKKGEGESHISALARYRQKHLVHTVGRRRKNFALKGLDQLEQAIEAEHLAYLDEAKVGVEVDADSIKKCSSPLEQLHFISDTTVKNASAGSQKPLTPLSVFHRQMRTMQSENTDPLDDETKGKIQKLKDFTKDYQKFNELLQERFLFQAIQETQKNIQKNIVEHSPAYDLPNELEILFAQMPDFAKDMFRQIQMQAGDDEFGKYYAITKLCDYVDEICKQIVDELGSDTKKPAELENFLKGIDQFKTWANHGPNQEKYAAIRNQLDLKCLQFWLSEKNFETVNTQTRAAFLGKNKEIIDILNRLKQDPQFINDHAHKQQLEQLEKLYKTWFDMHYEKVKKRTWDEIIADATADTATALGLVLGGVSTALWVTAVTVPVTAPLFAKPAFILGWVAMVASVDTAVKFYKMGVAKTQNRNPSSAEIKAVVIDLLLLPLNLFGQALGSFLTRIVPAVVKACVRWIASLWNNAVSNVVDPGMGESFGGVKAAATEVTAGAKLKNSTSATSLRAFFEKRVQKQSAAVAYEEKKEIKNILRNGVDKTTSRFGRGYAYLLTKSDGKIDYIDYRRSYHAFILTFDQGSGVFVRTSKPAQAVYAALNAYKALAPDVCFTQRVEALTKLKETTDAYLQDKTRIESSRMPHVQQLNWYVQEEIKTCIEFAAGITLDGFAPEKLSAVREKEAGIPAIKQAVRDYLRLDSTTAYASRMEQLQAIQQKVNEYQTQCGAFVEDFSTFLEAVAREKGRLSLWEQDSSTFEPDTHIQEFIPRASIHVVDDAVSAYEKLPNTASYTERYDHLLKIEQAADACLAPKGKPLSPLLRKQASALKASVKQEIQKLNKFVDAKEKAKGPAILVGFKANPSSGDTAEDLPPATSHSSRFFSKSPANSVQDLYRGWCDYNRLNTYGERYQALIALRAKIDVYCVQNKMQEQSTKNLQVKELKQRVKNEKIQLNASVEKIPPESFRPIVVSATLKEAKEIAAIKQDVSDYLALDAAAATCDKRMECLAAIQAKIQAYQKAYIDSKRNLLVLFQVVLEEQTTILNWEKKGFSTFKPNERIGNLIPPDPIDAVYDAVVAYEKLPKTANYIERHAHLIKIEQAADICLALKDKTLPEISKKNVLALNASVKQEIQDLNKHMNEQEAKPVIQVGSMSAQ